MLLLGVTFQSSSDMVDANGSFIPYGLPAVSEFLRYSFNFYFFSIENQTNYKYFIILLLDF